MTKIEELKQLSAEKRAECLERTFQKNKKFFSEKYPAVGEILRLGGAAPFHITVTDEFLTISNTETGELCHPDVGLDRFAETLGDWTNQAWIDLIEGTVRCHQDYGKYSQFLTRFYQSMLTEFPGLNDRMNNRLINLPTLKSGKRFSNPVVFVGVFHGLHIDHYLSHTQISNVAFIEPDRARFVLSCYFLDYQAIEERLGDLILHIGDEFPVKHIELFFKKSPTTAPVWVRILPGYASDKVEPMMREFRLRWRRTMDTWIPAEWQLDALVHAKSNIESGEKIFTAPTKLSSNSRIAIVGSGPSLSGDLEWLKNNQDQMVIFAAYSAVSALQQVGIDPDFQINIETREWDEKRFARFQLDKNIPIVTMVGDVPDKFNAFSEVLRLPEKGGINPVNFNYTIPFLSPTTGNTALGFACACKPSQIYLFGLDFGFRQAAKTHVEESLAYQDEATHRLALGSENLPVDSNFSDVEEVYTQSYYNLARLFAQGAIARVSPEVKVFNCSDGARILGATPCRSNSITSQAYKKSADVDLIRSMFSPMEKGVHWEAMVLDGATQLTEFKKSMLRELKMKKFNWLKFTQAVDNFRTNVEKSLPKKINQNIDNRIDLYVPIISDLLTAWYRLLCFTNTEDEWQKVYTSGQERLALLIDELEWPDSL